MLAPRRRLGLLTPFKELPGEYCDVVADAEPGVVQWQVVTTAADSHRPDDLLETAAHAPLADGVRRLVRWRPDAIFWACTSGSFILGREGSIRQCVKLERAAGVPVRSTSLAFVGALRALGVDEVQVLSPYPRPAGEAFASYLDAWGVGVNDLVCLDYPGATASEELDADGVRAALPTMGRNAVTLIPDTATWGFELAAAFPEHRLLTANQVSLWLAFALLGIPPTDGRFGLLHGVPSSDPLQPENLS